MAHALGGSLDSSGVLVCRGLLAVVSGFRSLLSGFKPTARPDLQLRSVADLLQVCNCGFAAGYAPQLKNETPLFGELSQTPRDLVHS